MYRQLTHFMLYGQVTLLYGEKLYCVISVHLWCYTKIATKPFWRITFTLWFCPSVSMGVVSSRITERSDAAHMLRPS